MPHLPYASVRKTPAAPAFAGRVCARVAAAVFLTATSLAAQSPSREAAIPLITLRAAVAEALQKNPEVLDSAQSVESAKLAVRSAASQFTPKAVGNALGALAGTALSNQAVGTTVSQRFVTGTQVDLSLSTVNNRNQIGSYYSTDTVLRFTQPLLRGRGSGPTRRELEDAESELRSAEAKGAETRRDVALQVATAYLQVVTATRVAAVAEKTLERASTLREAAQAKLTAGIVSRLDVLRAQQLVAQAEAEQLNALAAVEDAKDALRVLLTRPPDWPFRVEIDLHATDLTIGAEEAVRTALDRREELRTAKEDFSQADRAVAFRRNQLLPEFDLGLALTRYGTATDLRSSFGVNDFHLATFAGVSIPIDRTAAQIDLQNALFERERRRRAIDATSAHIIAGVRQALRQLDLARRSSQMAEAGVGLAREEAEVAGLRYQRGLSDNLDVVKAEADLLAADCRRMAATADLMLAGLKLRAALGVLDPDADIG